MQRRELLKFGGAGLALVAWPAMVHAQQAGRSQESVWCIQAPRRGRRLVFRQF